MEFLLSEIYDDPLYIINLLLVESTPMLGRVTHVLRKRVVEQSRGFMSRSNPRLGHNLEDYYLWPEYHAAMVNPMFEYAFNTSCFLVGILSVWPLMHSNYYFSGRFLPKDPDVSLLDDSW